MLNLNICIVNYKTPLLIIDCLASFLPELEEGTVVVIADNNSCDGSNEKISSWLMINDRASRCRVISLSINRGFSAGYNAAMRACPAHNYLLLNSDTIVKPGAFPLLFQAVTNYPSAGLFGTSLEAHDGTPQVSCFRDHSPLSELISAAGTRQVTTLLRHYIVPIPVTSSEVHPQWISFAAVLIRDDVLASVGMLDEGFFLYFEDCEYCHRVRKKGWDIVHVPQARIIHLHGQSSQMEAAIATAKRLPRYYYASRTRYFRLRYGIAGPTLANLGWCVGRLLSKLREIFGSKEPHLPEFAWSDIWTNWDNPLEAKIKKK